jgi:transposase
MARAAEEAAAQALETRPAQAAIDEVLRANLDAPRKQRHAITRIYDRLIAEHGMTDVSYPVVRAYVAERRPQIRADAGRGPVEVFVLQSHRPGAEAEVDFGEVAVQLAGEQVSCFLFCFRLSFSGKAVHRVSLSGGQEAFFEGHEHAFGVLGGVPAGKVRYDNLKSAVASVLGFTRARRRVRVLLHASHLVIYDGRAQVARRAAARQVRCPPGPGPLHGGAGPQARRAARGNRPGPGPRGRQVHPRPRCLVGRGAQGPRRRRRR